MNSESLFITAAKKKFRFATSKGTVSTEDLWDLSLASLDNIAVALDEQIQKLGRKSFVSKSTSANTDLSTQLEILKFVIESKQADEEARKNRAEKAGQRAFLESLLEKKKVEKLEGLTEAEIQAQLAALV